MAEDLAGTVQSVLEVDPSEFQTRAEEDGEVVKDYLRDGVFDNHQSIVGFEYEFYAAADGRWAEEEATDCTLMRVPRRLLELIGFEKELGLHNAEMSTSPQPFNPHGLRAQESEVLARLEAALRCTRAEGMRLVSDGLWTIPPAGETAGDYLADSVDDDGVRIATNMSDAARYHAMANSEQFDRPFRVDAPHVDCAADTVMPESLITSIQPHYQMSHAADLPHYFNYALRVAGPLLALGVNSPFFPPDLYEDDAEPREILDDAWMENRVAVFESVLNSEGAEKVTFPADLETVEQAVDRIVDDEAVVPMPVERGGDRFDDEFAVFRTKHGTYWRWIRPVFGGDSRSSANARIEFRPVPGQPTVRDSIAFQAAFAGLMESLPRHQHPVTGMEWETAEENFYNAVRDGLDADLSWVTRNGEVVEDHDRIYDDLLAFATEGLEAAGCSEEEAERYVDPLRARADEGITPAAWKVDQVEDRLDAGDSFADAVTDMQRAYIHEQADTLLDGTFEEWL